ncbi:acyltransferase family protein [Bailinhaonella thermotolerans]|uniref:acyltransferase family protein n=1 Tax=Bailinhaonella thermotolerans TaxID=1070861 RepID=UPI00192A436F|nr:acyltransferase [Bailinhaonella thermotolerans]
MLDLLRFGAAFAVLCVHYLTTHRGLWGKRGTEVFPEVAGAAQLGNLGVQLFFVISGFVILMSVQGRGVGDFAVSRVARLFPAYWLSVAAFAVVYLATSLASTSPRIGARDYLTNLTMMQAGVGAGNADVVYWTLWVELRFYVLVCLLAAVGATVRNTLGFMAGWLVVSVYAQAAGNELLKVVFVPKHAPFFIAGMAFFLIHRYGSALIPWGFVGVAWVLGMHQTVTFATDLQYDRVPHADFAVMAVITAIFVLMGLVALGVFDRVRWRGLVVLGALTYPLYLFHQLVAVLLVPALRPHLGRWGVFAVTAGAAVLLSYLVYRFAERPGQRFLRARLRESLDRLRRESAPATSVNPPPEQVPVIPEQARVPVP